MCGDVVIEPYSTYWKTPTHTQPEPLAHPGVYIENPELYKNFWDTFKPEDLLGPPSLNSERLGILATRCAETCIRSYVDSNIPIIDLQCATSRSYLKQFLPLFDTPHSSTILTHIGKQMLNNAYINFEWDNIKCFLALRTEKFHCTGVTRNNSTTLEWGAEEYTYHFNLPNLKLEITEHKNMDPHYNWAWSNIKYKHLVRSLLLLCGDVESNPGPVVQDPVIARKQAEFEHQKQMRGLQRQIAKLLNTQQRQARYIHKQEQMKKQDSKRKRKQEHAQKYAQAGIMDFIKNVGTVADTAATNIGPTTQNANTTMDALRNASTALSSTASSVALSLEPTLVLAQQALTSMISAGDGLKALFKIPENFDLIAILISLISICSAIVKKEVLSMTMHCVQLARTLGVSIADLMGLVPRTAETVGTDLAAGIIFKDAADNEARVSQSLISDMFNTAKEHTELLPFAGFLAFFCGIFNLLCTGCLPSPTEMTKHFTVVGRAAQGFRSVRDLFTFLSDYVSELYHTTLYGMTAEEYQFMQCYPQLCNIYAATKIIVKLDKQSVDGSAEIANQILAIYHQLNEYEYTANKAAQRINGGLIRNLKTVIKSQYEWATHSSARAVTLRQCPLALYLYGEPGVGKSVMTEVLRAMIFRDFLPDTNIDTCSYVRRSEATYWEGYTQQPILLLDDFGNVKDSVSAPVVEYQEFMNMVGVTQYPLNMAELKSKGVTNFTSEYIIASSNQKYPDVKHLIEPGAVYRRVGIWAEVTIDPKYGVPDGISANGNKYYVYDEARAKKAAGDKWSPLLTEHYRVTVYTVNADKQAGAPVVNDKTALVGLTFEEFYDYFKKVREEKRTKSDELSAALRILAGGNSTNDRPKEQAILAEFDKIFNPDKFLDAVALDAAQLESRSTSSASSVASSSSSSSSSSTLTSSSSSSELSSGACCSSNGSLTSDIANLDSLLDDMSDISRTPTPDTIVTPEVAGEYPRTGNTFVDADEEIDDILGSVGSYVQTVDMRSKLQIYFDEQHNKLKTKLCTCFRGLKKTASVVGSKLHSLAQFLLSLCQSAAGTVNTFLPSIPSSSILTSICATIVAVIGVWYTGMFCGLPFGNRDSGCKFVRAPSDGDVPCKKCPACLLLEFPSRGCMLDHYLDRTGIKSVRASLLKLGYDEDTIQDTRERVRRDAQRVYESRPAAARHQNYAQRVYESNPTAARHRNYAQGTLSKIECVTEVQIGARIYAQRDRVEIEQTTQTLLSNSVWLQAVDTNGIACRSNGCFLVGRTLITTAHTVLNPPAHAPIKEIVIRNPYSTAASIAIPYKDCMISQIKQFDGRLTDLALVTLPSGVPSRPRILTKFIDARFIDALTEGDMTFSGFYEVNGKTIVQEKHPQSFEVTKRNTEYFLHPPGTCTKTTGHCVCPIQIGNHIEYDLETHGGMCGALLSVSNNMLNTKLIGFHVAGGVGVSALGVLTTRELLENALSAHIAEHSLPASYQIDGRHPYSQGLVNPAHRATLTDEGDCLSIGTAKAPASPTLTQLQPSLIFDKIQKHLTKPALLAPAFLAGEYIDPMKRGIKKVLGPQTYIDADLLEAAANDVFNGLGLPETGQGLVHSYSEAITGIEGDPYKRPINRTTSPGYPYNLKNPGKGKTHWLGHDETYIVDNPALMADVNELLSLASGGIRGSAIALATLKDEKRPIEKVDQGKTRVFGAFPQHAVLAIRMFFMDFTAHLTRHRIRNGIAVGVNPYSLEWTQVADHLQQMGDSMVAGDFSNFDGSLLMQVLTKICEKINEWYDDGEQNALIRMVLWEHISNSDILVQGEVIRQTHSQPSGNPLTVFVNSLFNAIIMRCAYLTLKVEQGLPAICDYSEHVAEIIYGDDDIKSVHVDCREWFNQVTITKALAKFGLTYTDETKGDSLRLWKPLSETTFLKRYFVLQTDGTYLAPMDVTNILEITNWIKSKSKKAATAANCEQAIMELSQHPKETYDVWCRRIQIECNKVKVPIRPPTWFEQVERCRNDRSLYEQNGYAPIW